MPRFRERAAVTRNLGAEPLENPECRCERDTHDDARRDGDVHGETRTVDGDVSRQPAQRTEKPAGREAEEDEGYAGKNQRETHGMLSLLYRSRSGEQ